MDGLQDAGLILAIISGFLLASGPEDNTSSSTPLGRLLELALAIPFALGAVFVLFWSHQFLSYPDVLVRLLAGDATLRLPGISDIFGNPQESLLFAGVFVDLFIGMIAGVLIGRFWYWLTSKRSDGASVSVLVARALPIVVLLLTGFFRTETAVLIRSFESVEAGGVTVRLDTDRKPETEMRVEIKDRSIASPSAFQAGANQLLAALRAVVKDARKIYEFCIKLEPNENLSCLKDQDMVFKVNELVDDTEQTEKRHLRLLKYVTLTIRSSTLRASLRAIDFGLKEERASFFRTSIEEAVVLLSLEQCIETFRTNFPNGVPIIDELSELAADLTVGEISSHGRDQSPGHFENNLDYKARMERIFSRIVTGAAYVDARTASFGDDPSCRLNLDISGTSAVYFTAFRLRRLVESRLTDPTPYHHLLTSAILWMSGHVEESIKNLQTALDDRIARYASLHGSSKPEEIDFIEFLFRLQLLSHLDQLHDQSLRHNGSAKIAKDIRDLMRVGSVPTPAQNSPPSRTC